MIKETISFAESIMTRAFLIGAEPDLIVIEKLFMSMLICLKGRIDEWVPEIIKLQFSRPNFEDNEELFHEFVLFDKMKTQMLSMCLAYNTHLTL